MKKQVTLLLILTLLLSSLPLPAVAAEAALPKDTSGGLSASNEETEVPKTDYDALYVGADGSTTAAGGTLVALYTAYGNDPSLLLSQGKWQNKMDATGATDATLVGGSAYWKKLDGGGVGYSMNMTEWTASNTKVGLSLPDAFASLYSFSVETVSAIKGIRDASGALQAPDSGITAHQARSSFRMELFTCAFFAGYDPTNNSQSFCGRWFLSRKSPVGSKWGTQNAIKYLADDTWKVYGFNAPAVLGTSYTKQTAANGVAYTIAYHGVSIEMQMGGGFYGPSAYFVKKEDYTALTSTSYDDYAPVFSLYNGLPADVYAIRVYSMPLTEAERNHNFFIDLMAITGTPLDAYLSLSTAARAVLETALSILPMTSTAEEVESAIASAMATLPQPLDKSSLLYVTDGLTAIFTSLPHLSTGESLGENGGNWFNGLGGESASLVGSGWKKSARGGITIERDLDAFNASSEFGLVLPGSLLPEKDYTVELLANPTGITQRDENGVLSHYVDERSISVSTGIWREYGFGIGPLRALQACCLRPAGIDASLERRWVYNATGGCQALGWQYRRTDMVWADLTIEQVTTLSITYEFVEKKSNYAVYSDQEKLFDLPISEAEYKTPDESGRMFRLMCSVAGTVFAVRVYDRALSEVELAQNHVADLLYYYGLDADVLLKLMEIVPSGTDLFTPYQSLGFELTHEEAQKEFDRLTVGIWLSYEGVGLREKGGEALRYYFGLKQDGVNGLLAAGFGLELGVMLNVGKNVLPLLEGNDYDYKIPVFTSKTGRATGFFTDDDTFAVTLLYHNLDKASALSNILARGYVRLLSPDGEEMVFYLDLSEKDFSPSSLFNVCYQMDKSGTAKGTSVQSLVSKAMERSSTLTTVYVQAGAPAGGNGTKDSPFCSFTDGWLKCKEILAKATEPTKVILYLGDGEYHVYETLTLTEKDMPSPYSFFEILSANGKSVLTTTVDLDASRFTETSDNLWVYQLAKKNGIYPAFRYLYVDGERAEIAHATGESDEDADIQVMGFPRTYDGIYSRVKALYEAGTLTSDTKSGYPAARTDLNQKFEAYKAAFLAASSADEVPAPDVIAEGKMYFPLTAVDKHGSSGVVTGLSSEAYMAMQWYFNIVRIVKIDFDDTATDESGNTHVACYFDPEEYQYFYEQSGHVNTGRYVCLFNDPLYLDEEGEMYYDRATGKVYYYTEEDLTKKRVERPTLDYLLKLENVKNVSFTDISFTGLDDYHMSENPTCFHLGGLDHMTSTDTITYAYDRSALYLGNVENVTLYDCRFYQLPAKAIQAQGVVNGLTVEACSFENLGGNGIYFGHGRTVWDDDTQCENATVTDCYFGGIGQIYRNSAAIFFTVLKDGRILNNTIEDCAYTAISVGFSYSAKAARPSDKTFYNLYNVEIAYNYITDFMTELGDGAAIYVAGGNSDNDDTRYFNEMHHNYVVMSNRTGNGVGHMVVGLYFDGATSNWRCYNNVIAEHSYGAFAGEDDWLLAEGDPYVTELRNRATDCYYIYLQYIKGQEAWNILCQNNIILNVRATDPKKQEEEVFSTLVKSERNLFAEGTVYSNGVSRIPPLAEDIAYGAGCYGHYGDPSCLGGNDY